MQDKPQTTTMSWLDAALIYKEKPVMAMALLGFSAGLPFLLVFSTLSAWLRDYGVSRTTIGFFAWVGITYSIKVFWAPVVDRAKLPIIGNALGQRRSWMLLGQVGIALGLVLMSVLDPANQLVVIALAALLVAFSSSTQDIAIDAYRIEAAVTEYQGAMSAAYILGYRVALLVSGAGALFLADWLNWPMSYMGMAALMLVGMLTVFWVAEPKRNTETATIEAEAKMVDEVFGRPMHFADMPVWQQRIVGAVICPFLDFFKRNGHVALIILLFVAVFRLSDITMGIMANPFYLDMGYSKSEIASIAKGFGFVMTIVGSALCGVWVVKWGLYRPLLLGAVLVASTNVLFALLAMTQSTDQSVGQVLEPSLVWLTLVISADNLSGGIASTAFVAYLSSLTNKAYTATQYALFSSLMTLPGKVISGFSGWMVDTTSYTSFFLFAAAIGIPAIVLVLVLRKVSPSTTVNFN